MNAIRLKVYFFVIIIRPPYWVIGLIGDTEIVAVGLKNVIKGEPV